MEKEYLLAFSSFYKAAYARDMLEEVGVTATLRKLPTELLRSCATGVYIRCDNLEQVKEVFDRKQITVRGIYRIDKADSDRRKYIKVR